MSKSTNNMINGLTKERIAYLLEIEKKLDKQKVQRRYTNLRYKNTTKGRNNTRKACLKYYYTKNNRFHPELNPTGEKIQKRKKIKKNKIQKK